MSPSGVCMCVCVCVCLEMLTCHVFILTLNPVNNIYITCSIIEHTVCCSWPVQLKQSAMLAGSVDNIIIQYVLLMMC